MYSTGMSLSPSSTAISMEYLPVDHTRPWCTNKENLKMDSGKMCCITSKFSHMYMPEMNNWAFDYLLQVFASLGEAGTGRLPERYVWM